MGGHMRAPRSFILVAREGKIRRGSMAGDATIARRMSQRNPNKRQILSSLSDQMKMGQPLGPAQLLSIGRLDRLTRRLDPLFHGSVSGFLRVQRRRRGLHRGHRG